jgi:hypothetical protein
LQVDHRVVLAAPERFPQRQDFMESLELQRGFAPLFGGSKVQAVDQRLVVERVFGPGLPGAHSRNPSATAFSGQ